MPSPKTSALRWKQFLKGIEHQAAMRAKLNANASNFIPGKTLISAEPKGTKKGSANVRTAKRGGRRITRRKNRN